MIGLSGTFLEKAQESVAGARAELNVHRYSNSANRSYYAVFQAAIHAILTDSIRSPRPDDWDHGSVQNQFNGILINRRRRYSPDLRPVLGDNYKVRVQADYTTNAVSETQAVRALRRAERFVETMVHREGES